VRFLRRFVLILIGILLAVFVGVLLMSPDTITNFAASIAAMTVTARAIIAIVLIALILTAIFLLVKPGPRPQASGLIVRSGGALADISVESVRERVLKAVREIDAVSSVDGQVAALQGKADIELDVIVEGEHINVPEKQKEIDRALEQVVNKQLGLSMAGKPRVHIQLVDVAEPVAQAAPSVVTRVEPAAARQESSAMPPTDEVPIIPPAAVIAAVAPLTAAEPEPVVPKAELPDLPIQSSEYEDEAERSFYDLLNRDIDARADAPVPTQTAEEPPTDLPEAVIALGGPDVDLDAAEEEGLRESEELLNAAVSDDDTGQLRAIGDVEESGSNADLPAPSEPSLSAVDAEFRDDWSSDVDVPVDDMPTTEEIMSSDDDDTFDSLFLDADDAPEKPEDDGPEKPSLG
jgi:hypothetical protein